MREGWGRMLMHAVNIVAPSRTPRWLITLWYYKIEECGIGGGRERNSVTCVNMQAARSTRLHVDGPSVCISTRLGKQTTSRAFIACVKRRYVGDIQVFLPWPWKQVAANIVGQCSFRTPRASCLVCLRGEPWRQACSQGSKSSWGVSMWSRLKIEGYEKGGLGWDMVQCSVLRNAWAFAYAYMCTSF